MAAEASEAADNAKIKFEEYTEKTAAKFNTTTKDAIDDVKKLYGTISSEDSKAAQKSKTITELEKL
jgi:hypothetical protein